MNAISAARPLVLSSGAVEGLKWIAVACMVVDHVNAVMFDRHLGELVTLAGRIAFPIFAIVLGYNLARPGVDRCKVLVRLVAFGTLASVPFVHLFGVVGVWPLNVMFTFAVAVCLVWALDEGNGMAAAALFFGASCFVEYFHAGTALVASTVMLVRWHEHRWPWVPFLLSLVLLCWLNGNLWALLALPIIAAVQLWSPHVPRCGRFFWWFYPAHLVILAMWSGVSA